jgi:hypothetical protein
MNTVVDRRRNRTDRTPGRRYDRFFFPVMVGLLIATVGVGFAHTYYLAGVFQAPLASRVLHVHGLIFSAWMLLLLVQITLVSAHRTDIHRRLGIAGFVLAGLIVVFGIVAAADSLARQGSHATAPILSFSITPFTDMLMFAVLAGWALRERSNPSAHKRLILLATIVMMRAAIFRWPFTFVYHNQIRAILVSYIFIAMLVCYDLWSMRKLHRVTLWATSMLVFVQAIRIPIGQTETWHRIARWVQSWGV